MARAYRPVPKKALTCKDAAVGQKNRGILAATATWIASLKPRIPTGYQDETGFHFGDKGEELRDQPRA